MSIRWSALAMTIGACAIASVSVAVTVRDAAAQETGTQPRRVIVFVWDGLRADDITLETMPRYLELARTGVVFADHHAVYPTFTMMNSASIATGAYPQTHGFYGNVVYVPNAKGNNAKGAPIDFSAPAFIEDFGVVEAVRDAFEGRLTLVPTLLQAAQANGLTTAAVGKFGAAFIQDYHRGGVILDEDAAMPVAFARELQAAGYALPRNTVHAHGLGAVTLAPGNGDPTASKPVQRLDDRETANPLDRSGALARPAFRYLTDVFVDYILPVKKPDLTIFWSKEPDATNHAYGPGTYNSLDASKLNDEMLGRVLDKLRALGWDQTTDIIITQDHNHSTVSGDVGHFPLRAVLDGRIGPLDPSGYSVSGFVRTAALLRLDGLKAFDGAGCRNIPVLSGMLADGSRLEPDKRDEHGAVCGKAQPYTSPPATLPRPFPPGAIVVAANAGSDYLFIPDRDAGTVRAAVQSLQSRLQFGAVFVSHRYGEIPGTLPLSLIKADGAAEGRGPDIIVSFSFDETIAVAGRPGISYASSVNRRGDHGSFARTDTHISLMARGPSFKSGLRDTLPTGNVDIAPTVARILGLDMRHAQGRVIDEALAGGPDIADYAVTAKTHRSATKNGLVMKLPTDGRTIVPHLTTYAVELATKVLTRADATHTYFDQAKAIRE